MLPLHVSLSYYKREDIRKAIVEAAKDREIAVRYNEKFGQRPDVLLHDLDVLECAKQKASSFHCSEERWLNPLQLSSTIKRHEMDDLRIGWDLVLDIDCSIFEYSRLAADLVIKALKFQDIKSVSCKFSGNKGFHIGIPFEAFPDNLNNHETEKLFPDAARRIAAYITEMIKKPLANEVLKLENYDFGAIIKKTGKKSNEIIYYETNDMGDKIGRLNVEPFLEIDTILIAPRHLYRMPYSLHEKSGLVSLPIDPATVLQFERDDAKPEKVRVSEFVFLDRKNVVRGEANNLVTQAYDVMPITEAEDISLRRKQFVEAGEKIPEVFFPPCIKLLDKGLSDGKKRAVFILINFLSSCGWPYDDIEQYLKKWNEKNPEPLREGYVQGQLRHHKQQKKRILPANCANKMYYDNVGICKPDSFCSKIKNPASYTLLRAKIAQEEEKKTRKKKKSVKKEKQGNEESKEPGNDDTTEKESAAKETGNKKVMVSEKGKIEKKENKGKSVVSETAEQAQNPIPEKQ